MAYFLYGLFFVSCLVLIGAVLLQPGKTDAGALFTSNISSTAFTPRGAQSVLSKLTIIAATVFMLSALLLAMPALTGNISVLQTAGETPTETAPALDSNANVEANPNQPENQSSDANATGAAPAASPAAESKPEPKAEDGKTEEKSGEKKAEEPKKEESKPENK